MHDRMDEFLAGHGRITNLTNSEHAEDLLFKHTGPLTTSNRRKMLGSASHRHNVKGNNNN